MGCEHLCIDTAGLGLHGRRGLCPQQCLCCCVLGRAGEAVDGSGLPGRLGSFSCAVCIAIVDNGS